MKIEQFLNFIKVQVTYENSQVFEFQNGQVASKNRTVWVCVGRLPVKIDQFLNFKKDRSPMIIRSFSFKTQSFWMSESLSKLRWHFFFTSLLCKTLMRFCFISIVKRGHLLLPIFFYLIFYKLKKNRKITMKNLKIYFWCICVVCGIFFQRI